MKQIIGLEVVGIAACKGTNIADHLRDRAGFVWYFKEGVPGDAANRFVQKFFQRLNGGETRGDGIHRLPGCCPRGCPVCG